MKRLILLGSTLFLSACSSLSLIGNPGDKCSGEPSQEVKDYFKETGWEANGVNALQISTQKVSALKVALLSGVVPFSDKPAWTADELNKEMTTKSAGARGSTGLLSVLGVSNANGIFAASAAQSRPSLSQMREISGEQLLHSLSKYVPQTYSFKDQPGATSIKLSPSDDWIKVTAEALQAEGDLALVEMTAYKLNVAASDFLLASDNDADVSAQTLAKRLAEFNTANFLSRYFKAYFRSGHWLKVTLDTKNFSSAAGKLIDSKVGGKLDEATKKSIVAEIEKILSDQCKSKGSDGCLLTSPLGKDAFISRSGSSIQFKGVGLGIDYSGGLQANWDYPKSVEFAPQMVRVLTEAIYDARWPYVPAAANSTACMVDETTGSALYPAISCLSDATTGKYKFLKDAVARTDELAARADSLTGAASGFLIRSFWVAALNNETAAKSVENLASVIAKKQTERFAWNRVQTTSCPKGDMPAAWKAEKSYW